MHSFLFLDHISPSISRKNHLGTHGFEILTQPLPNKILRPKSKDNTESTKKLRETSSQYEFGDYDSGFKGSVGKGSTKLLSF